MQKWVLETTHIDLDPGQRAYIYQKLAEFEPFLLPDSTIEVNVAKSTDEAIREGSIFLTLTLTADGTNLTAKTEGPDIFTAISDAKNKLIAFLEQMEAEVLEMEDTGS